MILNIDVSKFLLVTPSLSQMTLILPVPTYSALSIPMSIIYNIYRIRVSGSLYPGKCLLALIIKQGFPNLSYPFQNVLFKSSSFLISSILISSALYYNLHSTHLFHCSQASINTQSLATNNLSR